MNHTFICDTEEVSLKITINSDGDIQYAEKRNEDSEYLDCTYPPTDHLFFLITQMEDAKMVLLNHLKEDYDVILNDLHADLMSEMQKRA